MLIWMSKLPRLSVADYFCVPCLCCCCDIVHGSLHDFDDTFRYKLSIVKAFSKYKQISQNVSLSFPWLIFIVQSMYCTILLTILYLITFYVILDHNVVSNIFNLPMNGNEKLHNILLCNTVSFIQKRKTGPISWSPKGKRPRNKFIDTDIEQK